MYTVIDCLSSSVGGSNVVIAIGVGVCLTKDIVGSGVLAEKPLSTHEVRMKAQHRRRTRTVLSDFSIIYPFILSTYVDF
jgi:hypothetical protein